MNKVYRIDCDSVDWAGRMGMPDLFDPASIAGLPGPRVGWNAGLARQGLGRLSSGSRRGLVGVWAGSGRDLEWVFPGSQLDLGRIL